MADYEKTIKGLDICTQKPCYCTDCPYKPDCYLDSQEVMEDALFLLRKQHEHMAEQPEIVRCKDCISFYKNDNMFNTNAQKGMRCKACSIDPDWFCADGKRKDI